MYAACVSDRSQELLETEKQLTAALPEAVIERTLKEWKELAPGQSPMRSMHLRMLLFFHERLRLRVLFSLVRLVAGTNDSLVVNNRLSVLVPVYGVDARGRRHMIAGLRWLKRDLGLGPVIVPSGWGKRTGQWRSVI